MADKEHHSDSCKLFMKNAQPKNMYRTNENTKIVYNY